jgi:ribose-phosphate pyrophosphokinase
MKPIVLALPGNETFAADIATLCGAEIGFMNVRHFPDGESYVRIDTDVKTRSVIVVATLDRPDSKILPLFFTSRTLYELGVTSIGLVAPYLSYMRQDKRFKPGEAISSRYFSAFLSSSFNWLVTVDPHLHRYADLSELYWIPNRVVHAAPLIARWIHDNVTWPVLVGPDEESEQWVSSVAQMCNAPYTVLKKVRHGDREVEVSMPDIEKWRTHTPILVDDIISTARTMIETIGHLIRMGLHTPVCIGVHGVFAGDAFHELSATGATIVTSNTIPHSTNAIDMTASLAAAVQEVLNHPNE